MPQVIEETKLYKISGVEIFSAGTWNGRKHDINALHNMVNAFSQVAWTPGIKLGHDEKQTVAKSSGLPSCGWVERIYVNGDKLYADFEHLPEKVFNAIKSKAYRKVSCEVYYNIELNGTKFPHFLGAVALLGNEMPGVTNLNDVLSLYSSQAQPEVFANAKESGNVVLYSQTFEYEEEESGMNAEELQKQLEAEQAKTKALEAEKAEFAKFKEDSSKELTDLQEYKKNAEADKLKAAEELKKAKRETFMKDLEKGKLVTAASAKLVEGLLEDKAEFSAKLTEKGEEKSYTREEALKELLQLTAEAAKVNFDESSLAERAGKGQEQEDLVKEIEKYAADHKVAYHIAHKAVLKTKEQTQEGEE